MATLALDVGGTFIKQALVDETGKILWFDETPTYAYRGIDVFLPRLLDAIETDLKLYGYKVDRIGMSTCGIVASDGSIAYASDTMPGYGGTEMQKILNDRFRLPVRVIGDCDACAYGEIAFGAGKKYKDIVCMVYGTGIGGAVIINGRKYVGAHHSAGQAGHIVIHGGERKCFCGQNGCYEAHASTSALIADTKAATGKDYNGKTLFDEYESSNSEILRKVIYNWADNVVYGVASAIHLMDPECVVLGGGVLERDYIFEYIKEETLKRVLTPFKTTAIQQAVCGNKTNLLGAAAIVSGMIEE